MILVIGGAYQGKTAFARQIAGDRPEQVMEGLHEWIREALSQGLSREEAEKALEKKASAEGKKIFVADEIGYGIVPMDAFEREYREAVGRILCNLAGRADEVYRIVAGIPTKIKG